MIFRVLGGFMTLLFLFSVALQYNDPDPQVWMPLYGAAAIVSGWAVFRPSRRVVLPAALLALVAFVWAGTIAPRVVGHVSLGEMFTEYAMKTPAIEESREMAGLLLVGIWAAVVAIAVRRARP